MAYTSTEQPREKCTACNETGIGKDGWDCFRCDGDGWVFAAPAQSDAAPASTEQPEALRLADIVERLNVGVHSQAIAEEYSAAARELRRLHARVQELEAENAHLKDAAWTAIDALEAYQAQRVPLSDARIFDLQEKYVGAICPQYPLDSSDWLCFARAIEAAHGITQEKQ